MTLAEILSRAEKARVLTELKAELAETLGKPGQVPVPRGWNSGEALLFATLPPCIQEIIYRRRDQDSRALRNLQTTVAELRRNLTPSQSAQIKEIANAQ